jgi:hypothetical protein
MVMEREFHSSGERTTWIKQPVITVMDSRDIARKDIVFKAECMAVPIVDDPVENVTYMEVQDGDTTGILRVRIGYWYPDPKTGLYRKFSVHSNIGPLPKPAYGLCFYKDLSSS